MLHQFITANRTELILRCKAKVAKRNTPPPTDAELEHGIPVFLTQLSEILQKELGSGPASASRVAETAGEVIAATSVAKETAGSHGNELLLKGFTVDQVVLDYGDICQAITELAGESKAPITVDEFRILNRCLDNAIAGAVSEFAREQDRVISASSEYTINERLSFIADEFRNLINTAMLAMDAIKRGNVGIGGQTGSILDRSLKALQDLNDRAFVDVRLTAGIPEHRTHVMVSRFIEEIQVAAAIDANMRGLKRLIPSVEPGLSIEVDRQILAGALGNLIQNAFKFTKPNSQVSLKIFSAADRILFEVGDECGGLPPGDPEDLFRPFEQRSGDQTGLGLGLGISRRGVEANGGRLHVRDLPGKGCVFTIDLPKYSASQTGRIELPAA